MSRMNEEQLEVAVVDYGMGNRRSVEKALEHVGAHATVSGDPRDLSQITDFIHTRHA